jgi:hypothetical protein
MSALPPITTKKADIDYVGFVPKAVTTRLRKNGGDNGSMVGTLIFAAVIGSHTYLWLSSRRYAKGLP